jgi:hypothetical protein
MNHTLVNENVDNIPVGFAQQADNFLDPQSLVQEEVADRDFFPGVGIKWGEILWGNI